MLEVIVKKLIGPQLSHCMKFVGKKTPQNSAQEAKKEGEI